MGSEEGHSILQSRVEEAMIQTQGPRTLGQEGALLPQPEVTDPTPLGAGDSNHNHFWVFSEQFR